MNRFNWLGIASINLAFAVGFGAFGAHGLKKIVTPEQLAWWQTGVLYWFFHSLGLLAIGVLIFICNKNNLRDQKNSPFFKKLHLSALLLQLGVLIFSGSLFALTLNAPRWLGAITPIGGILMIVGWLSLAWTAFFYSKQH